MNNNRSTLTLVEIGARIRNRRESLGMTQQDLADLVSITCTTVSRYENGETEIGVRCAENIAIALSVTVVWLLFGYDYENDIQKRLSRLNERDSQVVVDTTMAQINSMLKR